GANKEYGTNIIISDSTLEAVREGGFVVRFLDLVAVKGKTEPVAVYELIGQAGQFGSLSPELLATYEEGTRLYRAQRFEEAASRFAEVLAARLLWNRGVRDATAAGEFLAPASQALGQPARMAGVGAAVDRIRGAIRRGEGIGLHGDYDVDGVSATAVLAETLERLGARPI